MSITAQDVINLLDLEPLPLEGGYFRRTYQAAGRIPQTALPGRYDQDRAFGTAIYFLLTSTDFSAMHRLTSDEVYHFYLGDPLELLLLYPDGRGEVCLLGQDLPTGMRPQQVVPQGVWQGARCLPGEVGFSLVGTTMAPGFEWQDFELGERAILLEQYPDFAGLIEARMR